MVMARGWWRPPWCQPARGSFPKKSPVKSDASPVTSIQLPIITTGCVRSPSQSLGEDAQAESPLKTLRLTRSREKMDSGSDCGFAPHSGDAGGGGAIHQSYVDAADVDRSGRRDVLERAEAPASLPLDRFAADS